MAQPKSFIRRVLTGEWAHADVHKLHHLATDSDATATPYKLGRQLVMHVDVLDRETRSFLKRKD